MSFHPAMMSKLRMAIVVHGRFHAFDLARELSRIGHRVVVFTNYPRFVVKRFGIAEQQVRSFVAHGVAGRVANKLLPLRLLRATDGLYHQAFGRWAARSVLRESWDAVVAFSGVAEETFRGLRDRPTFRVLQRGSAHIAEQKRILDEEAVRVGRPIETPSDWMVAREQREYELSDSIHVLSGFAERSFQERGIAPGKVFRLGLGVDTAGFQVDAETVAERCRRILSKAPLRVLNVGTFCCRKGAYDWRSIVERLQGGRFHFRFVGSVAVDATRLREQMNGQAEFRSKRPQSELPEEYRWGDVFVLPTLEDGFAVVLNQTLAAGMPLITTTNCGGPDLIREGESGWVVPIRDPDAIVNRLQFLEANREVLEAAVRTVAGTAPFFDWAETARLAEANIVSGVRELPGF